jgi:hypothetical protein
LDLSPETLEQQKITAYWLPGLKPMFTDIRIAGKEFKEAEKAVEEYAKFPVESQE